MFGVQKANNSANMATSGINEAVSEKDLLLDDFLLEIKEHKI